MANPVPFPAPPVRTPFLGNPPTDKPTNQSAPATTGKQNVASWPWMRWLTYRLLRPEEWEKARPILKSFGQNLPNPENSLLSVAENGQIQAIMCFHPVYHGEPLWIAKEYRGMVDVTKLQESLTAVLPKGLEYYAFTPNRKMRWIAGKCHMKEMPWTIWKGIV